MIKKVALSILLASTAGSAMAATPGPVSHDGLFASIIAFFNHSPPADDRSAPLSAPEIDPASAISGLTLLLGGVAVVVGGKRRKSIALAA